MPRRRRSLFRSLFFAFRLALLLALTVGAMVLVRWSRDYDPRFYHFLGTPPGKLLSRVMKWSTLHNLPPTDKPDHKMSPEELALRDTLEAELAAIWPTHEVHLQNGEVLLGRVGLREPQGLWFTEAFGKSGSAEIFLAASGIRSVELYQKPRPEITWRDVRFQMEYPDFDLHRHGHYTILTDANYFQIADSIQALELLHSGVVDVFGSLIQHERRGAGIQVLFFTDEAGYLEHQAAYAPALTDSAGFYSPLMDRMVVFNQAHSQRATMVQAKIHAQIQDMLREAGSAEERRQIRELEDRVAQEYREVTSRETFATLRHEGMHHLCYTYGILSAHHAENGWLVEGLAVYVEADPPGSVPLSHLTTLLQMSRSGRWIPLETLVNSRSPAMLQGLEPEYSSYESYASAWSLVHFLMQPAQRDGFFSYIRFVRDPDSLQRLVTTPRVELLAEFLGHTVGSLEAAWRAHVSAL